MARTETDTSRLFMDLGDTSEPLGCPRCLSHRTDFAPPAEDHTPALIRAIRDVVLASTDIGATEKVPRQLWLAIQRAADVVQDVDPVPF